MKKLFVGLFCLSLLSARASATFPNDKVLKSFQATFLSPEEVKWYDHPEYFEVSFVQNNVRANVKYDLEGNFMSSNRYYKEQNLPTNILCKLKKKYPDKNVFGVTEVTTPDEIYYYIKLDDEKNWITIKVNGNGHMELFEKFKKA